MLVFYHIVDWSRLSRKLKKDVIYCFFAISGMIYSRKKTETHINLFEINLI